MGSRTETERRDDNHPPEYTETEDRERPPPYTRHDPVKSAPGNERRREEYREDDRRNGGRERIWRPQDSGDYQDRRDDKGRYRRDSRDSKEDEEEDRELQGGHWEWVDPRSGRDGASGRSGGKSK